MNRNSIDYHKTDHVDTEEHKFRKTYYISYTSLAILFFIMLQCFSIGFTQFLEYYTTMNYAKYFGIGLLLIVVLYYIEQRTNIPLHFITG